MFPRMELGAQSKGALLSFGILWMFASTLTYLIWVTCGVKILQWVNIMRLGLVFVPASVLQFRPKSNSLSKKGQRTRKSILIGLSRANVSIFVTTVVDRHIELVCTEFLALSRHQPTYSLVTLWSYKLDEWK